LSAESLTPLLGKRRTTEERRISDEDKGLKKKLKDLELIPKINGDFTLSNSD
jgi:hypothetical protein